MFLVFKTPVGEVMKRQVQVYFLDTVKVNDMGRYEVRLPLIEGHPPVPRNFNLAKKTLKNVVRKLYESKLKAAYDVLMD
jgi:hypothetical protein